MRSKLRGHFHALLAVLAFLLCFHVTFAQTIHVPTTTSTSRIAGKQIVPTPPVPPPPTPPAPGVSPSDKESCSFCPIPTVGKSSAAIQAFFGTNGPVAPLTQVGSVYNGASGSATVSADLVSLIMPGGWQAKITSNVQAGSTGETSVAQGTIPTLSASAAGQATQNMLYGGTIQFVADFPLALYNHAMDKAGGVGWELDVVSREGVDIQNFKANTSTTASSPPSHHSTQLESFFVVNSLNAPATGPGAFAGSIFIGGSYGYSYTSRGYARDYGFGKRVNNDIGQVSAGILITNSARVSISRAFGPSQTYIDSTTLAQTKVNNFKAWSFAITYQSQAAQ